MKVKNITNQNKGGKNTKKQFLGFGQLSVPKGWSFVFLVIIQLFSYSTQAQKSEDVLDYMEEKLWVDPQESIQLGERFLQRSDLKDDKKCVANYYLAKAHVLLEEYNESLDYLLELENKDCKLEPSLTLGYLLLKQEVYGALDLGDFKEEVVSEIEGLINKTADKSLKGNLSLQRQVYNDFNDFKANLFADRPMANKVSYSNQELDVEDRLLQGKYIFLTSRDHTQLQDSIGIEIYQKAFPNWTVSEMEFYYYHFFALWEATWKIQNGFSNLGVHLLEQTDKKLENQDDFAFYQLQTYQTLRKEAVLNKDQEKVAKYSAAEQNFSDRVDMIFTNALTKIYSNKSELKNKVRKEELSKTKFIRSLVIGVGILVSAVLLVLLLRYKWQEMSYQEISNYIQKMQVTRAKVEEELSDEPEVTVSDVSNKLRISKETEKQILKGLQEFEKADKYLDQEVSLAHVASELKVNTKYLSEVLNSRLNENFNSYINRLRVEYIVGKLKSDPEFLKYKISYLAEVTGYSSHSSFTTAFKSITGMPPTKFIGYLKREV